MKYLRHFLNVSVLVIITTFIVSLLLEFLPLLPQQASVEAISIDTMFSMHFRVISFLFALIVVFMLYSLVVFRNRGGETDPGDHFEGNTGLEIFWTIVPLIIVIYFAFIGAQSLADVTRTEPDALEVDVIAFQWSWSFEYPAYGVTSTTLYLPKDRQTVLNLTSRDVIHSFWVPEFRVKQDALPGKDFVRQLRITPIKTGDYMVRCAELCGGAHAYMNSPVVVVEPEEFEIWLISQQNAGETGDSVTRGKALAETMGCLSCHSTDGTTLVGPTWKNMYGHEVTLIDGTRVMVDELYLRRAILQPNDEIVEGFQPIMPSYEGLLTEEQIADLIAYMKSLE